MTRIPSFQWLSQAMNWRGGTWLGCGTGSHKAYGLPCHDAHPKPNGAGLFEVPFLWEQSLRQGSQGAAPGPNSHGLHGQRGSWSRVTCHQVTVAGREPRWAWVGAGEMLLPEAELPPRDTASKLQDSSADSVATQPLVCAVAPSSNIPNKRMSLS